MNTDDTIAAICTGLGGAVAIIRISGKNALKTGNAVWHGKYPLDRSGARTMHFGRIGRTPHDGEPAMAVYMPGPHSYTGEDIIELHGHGGRLACRRALDAVINAGARHAEPGEFTCRAFLNGKMELTQAEAVADLIAAQSDMALNLAEKQIAGKLGLQISALRNQLTDILAECESRLDFSEEELDWTAPAALQSTIAEAAAAIDRLLASGREGIILRDGIRMVLAGKPNVGKSSLLNLLLGFDRAIVSRIPGTTRDTLEETANLRNIPVRLIDTAGIREAEDLIEGLGIDRSKRSIREAQIVLWLLDAAAPNPQTEIDEMLLRTADCKNLIAVWNKTDMAKNKILPDCAGPAVRISVTEQNGIENLLDAFEKAVWDYPHTEEPEIAVSARHAALLRNAAESLPAAIREIAGKEWELAAIYLRDAVTALGTITGESADPDILENIFRRFCIGK